MRSKLRNSLGAGASAVLVFAAMALLPMRATADPVGAGPYSLSTADPENTFDAGVPGFVGPGGDGVIAGGSVNPAFVGWATGHRNYQPSPGVSSGWQIADNALGPVTGSEFDIVSLGDLTAEQIGQGVPPGEITLTFDVVIGNGPGADFAVFENGFVSSFNTGGSGVGGTWAELAFVEVSTDGQHFARFPTDFQGTGPVGGFGTIDPTQAFNLAGKHVNSGVTGQSWGTPFDLDGLVGEPLVLSGLLNLDAIRYVRLVDVPGSGDFLDAEGDPIYDGWLTFGSGGHDLEAVGVLNDLLLGDANFDGVVDLFDHEVWVNGFGTAGLEFANGDLDGNGITDLADYHVWANQFGAGGPDGILGPVAAARALSGIPEPSTGWLVLAGLATATALRLRRFRGAGR